MTYLSILKSHFTINREVKVKLHSLPKLVIIFCYTVERGQGCLPHQFTEKTTKHTLLLL